MYADLEELAINVRDPLARRLYVESIAAYRAGALRGAVVVLWTAVVLDIVAKLKELDLTGDRQATDYLKEFERARASSDVEAALRFERGILAVARDRFELLTHQEQEDLTRLQADRNRCAHPSMNSADEAYMPSAELVRYHLHSAGFHLLVRPPVQGKAALDRVFAEVLSDYFPRDVADAARVLRAGPLGRAKPALIRNFVVASVKAPLVGDEAADPNKSQAIVMGLRAVKTFAAAEIAATFAEVFPRIADQIPPESVERIVLFAAGLPEALDYLSEPVAIRVTAFVRAMPDDAIGPCLWVVLGHPRFAAAANERIGTLTARQLGSIVSRDPERAARTPELVGRVVEAYCSSRSWDTTNLLSSQALMPLSEALGMDAVKRVIKAASENVEVKHAFSTPEVLARLKVVNSANVREFVAAGIEAGLADRFPDVFSDLPSGVAASDGGDA